jgi:hypothetical protein
MRILKRLKCLLSGGHQFTRSNYYPGKMTCVRCHVRRKPMPTGDRTGREAASGHGRRPLSVRL